VVLVSITALIAVSWEFLEFIADNYIYHEVHFQPSLTDTLKDLLMGICGGYFVGALGYLKK
jgi:hypothetical protein